MSIQVSIVKGYYRGELVSGIFTLLKPYQEGARGGFVTIKNPNPKPGHPPNQRVTVEKGDFSLLNADGAELEDHVTVEISETGSGVVMAGTDYERIFSESETEDEAMHRIAHTFEILDKITDSVARGIIRGLVVSGPPGIGKSHGVEKQLETANMFTKLKGKEPMYEIISGGISGVGLYQKLYHNRAKGRVVVFDDCDGVLYDDEQLLLLKAALNSGERRRINWSKESRVLLAADIPGHFDFEAGIIFISNIDFQRTIERGSKLSAHLAAIMSRCHYLDLEMGSVRDRLLRIKQVIRDGMLDSYEFEGNEAQEIVDYVIKNAEFLREISLRMTKKIADFVKTDVDNWQELAEATCLQREAKFKRLLERKAEAEKRGVVLAES